MSTQQADSKDNILYALRSVVQEVNAAADLTEALEIIVNRTKNIVRTDVCSVYLHEASTGRYVFMATDGLNKQKEGRFSLEPDQGLVGLIAKREEPLNLENAVEHPNFYYEEGVDEEQFKAFLGVPIIHQKKVLGVLVIQQTTKRKFKEREEAFLVTLSAQLAGVIAHARVVKEAQKNKSQDVRGEDAKSRKEIKENVSFIGVSNSHSVAIGELVLRTAADDLKNIAMHEAEDVQQELKLFENSLAAARVDIANLAKKFEKRLAPGEQALFDVYLNMLDDDALINEVVDKIEQGVWAQGAWAQVIQKHVQTFELMEDAYLKERATDVKDLGLRVLKNLRTAEQDKFEYPDNTILVSDELTPSMLAEVPVKKLKGLVSGAGSSNSHVAILAQSLGLPIVMGVRHLPIKMLSRHKMIVDGYRSKVIINASDALCRRYQAIIDEDKIISQDLESLRDKPSETLDGHALPLFVNTGLYTDMVRSLDLGAQGIGLYRTEAPFLIAESFPTEEEQRNIYRQQLEAFAPLPVTMRTLDIGGDKALNYFPIKEDNPFLGWRGIRVTLDHPEIFLVQIRAMLKASESLNNLHIMLPMVSNFLEIDEALNFIQQAYDELKEEGFDIVFPKIGVMIEVPAAIYQAQEYAKRVDFMSVGSNDLTQYLLAVDRNNPNVASLYDSYHPAVLRACYDIAKAAKAEGKTISICGELAGDPVAAVLLLAMGYDYLSMNSTKLLRVKSMVRKITFAQAQNVLADVLSLRTPALVKARLHEMLEQLGVLNGAYLDKGI